MVRVNLVHSKLTVTIFEIIGKLLQRKTKPLSARLYPLVTLPLFTCQLQVTNQS